MSTSKLQSELRQRKPFDSAEEEVFVGLQRTASLAEYAFADLLKDYGITPTQYNVLRILRGAGAEGLCRNELRDRLVNRVPDATRLLERMADLGLVSRDRDGPDRRFVTTRLTRKGLDLVNQLDGPVRRSHRKRLGHLGPDQLAELTRLLDAVREAQQ
ncbi:MAG: MarR family winged helix-turn-helix transcriptional regulator [Gemmatimonadales bacterium]